jgi:hypothetical protein
VQEFMRLRSGRQLMASGTGQPLNTPYAEVNNSARTVQDKEPRAASPEIALRLHSPVRTTVNEAVSTVVQPSAPRDSSSSTFSMSSPDTYGSASATLGGEPSVNFLTVNDSAFSPKAFFGASNKNDEADKWWDAFTLYADFKKLTDADRVRLFKLLMRDQAAVWLKSLTYAQTSDIGSIEHAFKERYALTPADRWKQTADIWSRQQSVNESVDDYVANMQVAATRVDMPDRSLVDAVIKGLKPHLRVAVLQHRVDNLRDLLSVARITENATSDDANSLASFESVTAKLDILMKQQQETAKSIEKWQKVATSISAMGCDRSDVKRVTFSESAISSEGSRPASPLECRSPARQQFSSSTYRQPERSSLPRPADQTYYASRNNFVEGQQGYGTPRQNSSTSWRQNQPASLSYGGTRNHQQSFSKPSGNCGFCGRRHQFGRSFCPAAHLQCFNCSRVGHVARMCRQTVNAQAVMFENSH